MQVFRGRSFQSDVAAAVAEATQDWDLKGQALDLVFAFSSTQQDPDKVASEVSKRFPNVPVVGCTSSGENYNGDFSSGAIVIAGLVTPNMSWNTVLLENISQKNELSVQSTVNSLFSASGVDTETLEPSEYFCLMFVDGLQLKEEWVSATLAQALEGISLIGGSAGDDLRFEQTKVYHGGKSHRDAAVLVLAHCPQKNFSVFKHQHFTATERRLIVTKCDPEQRRVYEMNGFPAAEAYARALETLLEDITDEQVFMNPATIAVGGDLYVRSVKEISKDDGSIAFHCAVEEGMIMHFGGHHDMAKALGNDVSKLVTQGEKRCFFLSFNCILRRLEANQGDNAEKIKSVLNEAFEHSVGFDTYGEQFNGLHINQTMVAVAIG